MRKIGSCSMIAGVAASFMLTGSAFSTPIINEVRIDDVGTDENEYFELFGNALESLAGLTYLVIGDGAGGSGTIEHVTDLGGLTLDASGYFLAAEASYNLGGAVGLTTTLGFENSDNVTHLLVQGFTGANGDDLDVGDDGVLEITPWTAVLDAVSLIETVGTGDLVYATSLGGADVGPDGTFVPGHAYRAPDGGAWVVGGFTDALPPTGDDTPGFANIPEPGTLGLLALGGLIAFQRRRRN